MASFARVRLLAGLMLAIGCLAVTMPAASAQTRTLKLYFIHTKERAEITYKRNGRYDSRGLQQVNRLLRDWRRNEPTKMSPQLLDLLWEVYRRSGSRDYIHVVSAYRSPQTNAMLRKRSSGVASKSQHMLGKAIDFYLPDVRLSKLRAVAMSYQAGGVGYYPRSGSPFIHLDVGSARYWPRMSRRELASLFPDGKTVYVPSDGKPMPGYQQALASYEARRNSGNLVPSSGGDRGGGRGLLAALFGGGADEEEDNAEAATAVAAAPRQAPSRPAPQQATARQAPAEPEEPAETPATLLAALSQRSVPVPQAAPRPDENTPEEVPFQVKPAPRADEVPVGEENAPTPAGEDEAPTLVAANVPLPTRRPDYALPVPDEKPEIARDEQVQVASAAGEASDAVAELLAEVEATDAESDQPLVTAAYVPPLPSERPGSDDTAPFSVAAIPAAQPVSLMESASAEELEERRQALDDIEAAERADRITASQRLALLKNVDDEPAVVISSGVQTTGKAAKPGPSDLPPPVRPVVRPVKVSAVQRALKHESLLTEAEDIPHPPSFDSEFVRSPNTVYTTGFEPDVVVADARRFTGKAVNFMTMARFRTN